MSTISNSTIFEVTTNATLTMSSLAITDLVEARHDNVKRTMETLAAKAVISFTQSEETSHEGAGARSVKVYHVSKRDSYVVVAQLSPEFTARLVDRWQELENGTAALPKTLPEALRMAADMAEQKAKAEAALAIAAPKAEALDRIANQADGAVCLRIAAKLLQVPEKKFLQFAHAEGFIFRSHHSHTWQGYSEKAKAGLLEMKLTTVRRDDDSEKTVEQVLVTRAGLTKLAELIEKKRPFIPNTQLKLSELESI